MLCCAVLCDTTHHPHIHDSSPSLSSSSSYHHTSPAHHNICATATAHVLLTHIFFPLSHTTTPHHITSHHVTYHHTTLHFYTPYYSHDTSLSIVQRRDAMQSTCIFCLFSFCHLFRLAVYLAIGQFAVLYCAVRLRALRFWACYVLYVVCCIVTVC